MPASPFPSSLVHTFAAQGHRLRYRVRGEGRVVVLLHGLSGSRRWWRLNVGALVAAGCCVYTLELGAGMGVQQAAQLLTLWLEREELREVTLIGHSMGGQIAMNVAARSTRVTKLVLVCASGLLRGDWWKLARHLPRAGRVGSKHFLPTIVADSLRTGWPNLVRSVRDLLRDDVALTLPHITQPTLVVWGRDDALVPLALGQVLAQKIAHARLVVLEGGHVVMVDNPHAFNAAVLDFLNESGAP